MDSCYHLYNIDGLSSFEGAILTFLESPPIVGFQVIHNLFTKIR